MIKTENKRAPVFVEPGSVYCSAGNNVSALWQALANGQQHLSALPCPAYDTWPWPQVFMVEEPGASELGVDRKILRTMEKQAKMALYGAALAVQQVETLSNKSIGSARKGLYLALPTVDESVPPWSLLETLHEVSATPAQPKELSSSEFLQREIPAFFGLSTLNSNACAHISACFDLTGAMGAYSPFADAAFQALIDATGAIAQGENTVALVGGVSPKVNPQLLLQYEHWGWDKIPAFTPAEGSSFVVLTANKNPGAVCVSGFARGFICNCADASGTYQQLLAQALSNANITAADIDWFLSFATDGKDIQALFALGANTSLPILSSESCMGFAGAAGPLINLNLALHGLQQQKYLVNARNDINGRVDINEQNNINAQENAGALRHVALSAAGPEGQYIVVILSREAI